MNCTPVTPTLSDAVPETTTALPETVAPDAGAVSETVGCVVSTGCAATETVADCDALPPLPVQVAVYVVFAVRDGVTKLPEVPEAPLVTVHEVLLVLDQAITEVPPYAIEDGVAVMVTLGDGSAETVTIVLCDALPPAPVHVSVYVVLLLGVTDCVPEVALVPVHPPLAVQLVLFVVLHERVDD